MKGLDIPDNVKNTPAGPDGNGFMVIGLLATSFVGSDGGIYVRRNGIISIAEDEALDAIGMIGECSCGGRLIRSGGHIHCEKCGSPRSEAD